MIDDSVFEALESTIRNMKLQNIQFTNISIKSVDSVIYSKEKQEERELQEITSYLN